MLTIGCSASGKTNALLNLIKEKNSNHLIDKIYFYAKDLNEAKYQFLIKNPGSAEIKHLNNQKAYSVKNNLKNIQYIWMKFTIILMIITQT